MGEGKLGRDHPALGGATHKPVTAAAAAADVHPDLTNHRASILPTTAAAAASITAAAAQNILCAWSNEQAPPPAVQARATAAAAAAAPVPGLAGEPLRGYRRGRRGDPPCNGPRGPGAASVAVAAGCGRGRGAAAQCEEPLKKKRNIVEDGDGSGERAMRLCEERGNRLIVKKRTNMLIGDGVLKKHGRPNKYEIYRYPCRGRLSQSMRGG